MNYGFVIDNRKCIGCHACTVACKSEHEVPVGVNRTHVKYVEKGTFPHNRRYFAVHRCNHCEAPPCVDICPTGALFKRTDGVVDFDHRRCIGCKSCMQACPYDALYIDPDSRSAAKCNYCAHRLDGGYEPACVVICPVEAIVSGDLDNPLSTIAQLVDSEPVTVRKPGKRTRPNVYYIDGNPAALDPALNARQAEYLFSGQAGGVGHFAGQPNAGNGYVETEALIRTAIEATGRQDLAIHPGAVERTVQELADTGSRRVYDAPDKGVLWGWEVTGYIWTKALATGTFIVTYLQSWITGIPNPQVELAALGTTLVLLLATTILLVKDLDRPGRFAYVLLRPNWTSWITRGGYILTLFIAVTGLLLVNVWFGWSLRPILAPLGLLLAILTANYTAFLLAQAKGRDLWRSPATSVRMLAQALTAGVVLVVFIDPESFQALRWFLGGALAVHLALQLLEVFIPHDSTDAARAGRKLTHGTLAIKFYSGIVVGGILPLALLLLVGGPAFLPLGLMILGGLLLTEYAWIRAPQLVPLS